MNLQQQILYTGDINFFFFFLLHFLHHGSFSRHVFFISSILFSFAFRVFRAAADTPRWRLRTLMFYSMLKQRGP